MTPPDRQAFLAARRLGHRDGVRWAVTWLHREAGTMNDPHATGILNAAASQMGMHYGHAALAEAAPAEPVSVTKLAEEFISEGSILEEENYDADTRQRMLVSFNAGFNAGRKSAAPAGTGTENGELIERLRSTWSTTAEQARAATAIETLTRERDGLQAANTISDRIIGELNTEVMALEDTIAELRAQLEARPTTASEEILEDALHDIVRWADAYPLTAFPEPDIAKASELLKAGGMTLDAISASNMRHVVTGVGKIARKALAAALPRSPASPEPEKGK